MSRTHWTLGLSLVCAMSCGHGREATPPSAAATAAQVQPQAPQPDQPDNAPSGYEAAPLAAEEPPPVFVDSLATFMLEHFIIATWVRDSIVDGEIDGIRAPLNALADYGYENVAPGGWAKDLAQLQAAARVTAQAQSIDAAARGIAAMGRICGECHSKGGGPDVQHYKQTTRAPKADSFEARMFRHAWAVERLWEGLTAPSDNAWAAGAAALAQAPSAAPKADPALPTAVADTLGAVRALGAKAARADSFASREKVYGELLVTCAECHRSTLPPER